jgi:alanine dehydrogenase
VHYCVANMPGAVARTSTYALNNVTLPHALRLADAFDRPGGWRAALLADPNLAAGLNVAEGKVTCREVAEEHGMDWTPVADLLAAPAPEPVACHG